MNRLKDKVALVAGGASGIGRSAALLMAEEGARIVVADVNDAGGASVAAAIDQTGGTCRFVHLEVRNEEDWIKAVDGAIGEFGRLDVLSNSAGITMGGRKTMVCKQAWSRGIFAIIVGSFIHSMPNRTSPKLLRGRHQAH